MPGPRSSPTIKDIAATLGISHATVSRALNDSPLIGDGTKARVREAAARMGYLPDTTAKIMRGARANIIGFVLPDVENHFYSAIARVIARTVASAGMQLVLAISEDDPELEMRHVQELIQARAKGIIITPGAGLLPRTAELLRQIPCLQLVRHHPAISADVISAEDREATQLSTRLLLDLGHRHIAYVGGGPETLSTGADREAGFRAAMAEVAGSRPVLSLTSPRSDHGHEACRAVLSGSDRPTGLVLGSSQFTLGALHAIREAGLVMASDISLIAYDDPEWFEYWGEGISTIALPIAEMAEFAAAVLCEHPPSPGLQPRIEGSPPHRHIRFAVRMIRRGSCAQPRG